MADMKLEEIAAIEGEAKALREYWGQRDARMKEDRDIVNLVTDPAKTNKSNWVTNAPKVFYDTAVSLVSTYQPRFRMPRIKDSTDEGKESKAERLLIGIWRELDHRQLSRGQTYWLRELAYWVLSGWYAVFTMVDKQDKTKFIADFYDPMTVYPDWDSDGLAKCVRILEVDKRTAANMLSGWEARTGKKYTIPEPKDSATIRVTNYWRRDMVGNSPVVRNAILVGGAPVKPLTEEKQFKRIPIHIGAVGIPDRGGDGWQKRFGEHIISSNREVYRYKNEVLQLLVTILRETTWPNIVSKSQSGRSIITSPLKGYGEEIPLRLNETLELLKHAAAPAETLEVLNMIGRDDARGSFPDVVWGNISVETSGFGISQLMAAIKYKIIAYLNTMQYVMGEIATDFLEQYHNGEFGKLSLTTQDPHDIKKGQFYVEEFSKEDIPEKTYVEVTIPITSALDKTQQIIFARQALEPPALLSRETLWDDILEVQDPEQEYSRIIQDEMMEMPVMKQIALLEQLRERARVFEMEGRIAEGQATKRIITILEMQLQGNQNQGTPSRAPNPSPETMPPEMVNNPDMRRAATGTPPPRIVRPNGETLIR